MMWPSQIRIAKRTKNRAINLPGFGILRESASGGINREGREGG